MIRHLQRLHRSPEPGGQDGDELRLREAVDGVGPRRAGRPRHRGGRAGRPRKQKTQHIKTYKQLCTYDII